jgi:branched-chain amino acid transport system ATP-binding protein
MCIAQGRNIAAGSPSTMSRAIPKVIEAYLGHGAAARMQAQDIRQSQARGDHPGAPHA